MRIIYILDQDFPDRQTNTIQVANMGIEFARLGVPFLLVVRSLGITDRRALFARFGLEPHDDFRIEVLRRDGLAGLARWRGLPFVVRLANLLRKHATPDTVIYARGLGALEPTRLAAIVARPLGIPVVYEVHKFYARTMAEYWRSVATRRGKDAGFLARKSRPLEKIRRREAAMLRTVSGLVCINRGIEERLRGRFGPDRPIAMIPSSARAPERIPPEEERDLDVVYLGDVGQKKGVRVLIDAMARLPGRRLLLHGRAPDPDIEALREQIESLGLADRVTYGGWIEPGQISGVLGRARVSALPYSGGWAETTTFVSPLKVFELMLAGVPIVVSDLPTLREVVRHDETGLVVPPDDPEALATALGTLLDDRPRAQRLADAARIAVRPFTWEGRARRVRDFLEHRLVPRCPGGGPLRHGFFARLP